jgi:hypothetical protein
MPPFSQDGWHSGMVIDRDIELRYRGSSSKARSANGQAIEEAAQMDEARYSRPQGPCSKKDACQKNCADAEAD